MTVQENVENFSCLKYDKVSSFKAKVTVLVSLELPQNSPQPTSNRVYFQGV